MTTTTPDPHVNRCRLWIGKEATNKGECGGTYVLVRLRDAFTRSVISVQRCDRCGTHRS